MRKSGVSKRTVAVSLKISEADMKRIEDAAAKRWPKALMSRSSKVLSLALIEAERILEECCKKK